MSTNKHTAVEDYKFKVFRRPDNSFHGRPYVTSNGEHICEGFTNELSTAALAYLVEKANSAPALVAENARLLSALEDCVAALKEAGADGDMGSMPAPVIENAREVIATSRAALQGGGL